MPTCQSCLFNAKCENVNAKKPTEQMTADPRTKSLMVVDPPHLERSRMTANNKIQAHAFFAKRNDISTQSPDKTYALSRVPALFSSNGRDFNGNRKRRRTEEVHRTSMPSHKVTAAELEHLGQATCTFMQLRDITLMTP